MRISNQEIDNTIVVSVDGQISVTTVDNFRDQILSLIEAGNIRIVLDCALLTYISSAGFRALYEILDRLEEEGGRMAFCRVREEVRPIFEVTEMASDCPIFDSIEEAIQSVCF